MTQSDKESMMVLSMELGKFNSVCSFFDTSTLASELGVSDSKESILFPSRATSVVNWSCGNASAGIADASPSLKQGSVGKKMEARKCSARIFSCLHFPAKLMMPRLRTRCTTTLRTRCSLWPNRARSLLPVERVHPRRDRPFVSTSAPTLRPERRWSTS